MSSENIVPAADTKIDILPDKVLQVVNRSNEPRRNKHVTMFKVPKLLRQEKNNQQEYDPLVVSLGPYHHGKKKLQVAEDFKVTVLRKLVDKTHNDAKILYYKVLDKVNDARKCYIDVSKKKYDDPYFAQIMLLDACFIINCIVYGTRGLADLSSAHVFRDLGLLENQVPFWLLKMLIALLFPEENGDEMLDEFLKFSIFGENSEFDSSKRSNCEPLHLLHALQLTMFPVQEKIPEDYKPKTLVKFSKKCINLVKRGAAAKEEEEEEYSVKNHKHSFRSASELKTRGIHFRRSSCKDSFRCIRLKPGFLFATLEVPVWFVTMYSKGFFLNMIAYELCLDMNSTYRHSTYRVVMEYIAFMKVLIDSPKDVKELREHMILITDLGNDEDVVKVYKELNTYKIM